MNTDEIRKKLEHGGYLAGWYRDQLFESLDEIDRLRKEIKILGHYQVSLEDSARRYHRETLELKEKIKSSV